MTPERMEQICQMIVDFWTVKPSAQPHPPAGSPVKLVPISSFDDIIVERTGISLTELEVFHRTMLPDMRRRIKTARRKADWHNKF